MARTVQCTYLKKEGEGLDFAPYPGELGARIYNEISQQAYSLWPAQATLIINHYGLSLGDPNAQKILMQQMEEFFFGEDAKPAADEVDPFADLGLPESGYRLLANTGLRFRRTGSGYEVVRGMAEMGLFGLPFPEEYGGMGGGSGRTTPSGSSGRPGQRRLESTGAGRFWIFRRRLASPVTKSCGALASCWACSSSSASRAWRGACGRCRCTPCGRPCGTRSRATTT